MSRLSVTCPGSVSIIQGQCLVSIFSLECPGSVFIDRGQCQVSRFSVKCPGSVSIVRGHCQVSIYSATGQCPCPGSLSDFQDKFSAKKGQITFINKPAC